VAGGPADRTGAHDLGGVYYAIVTQNDDPDGPGGRVKVRYPWLPDGDRDQSHWAPVAVPMVGAGFGTYALEENQDGKNDFRLIRSRAGHRMLFDDSSKTKVVLSDMGDHHLIGLGQHGAQGSSPNAMEVPAMGAARGVAGTAATGALHVWCPKGKLTARGRAVEVTAADGVDIKGGTLELKATGSTTMSATGEGKFQGTTIKLGAG
jgi:hypothetical protein